MQGLPLLRPGRIDAAAVLDTTARFKIAVKRFGGAGLEAARVPDRLGAGRRVGSARARKR
jgi:hypothetical protein